MLRRRLHASATVTLYASARAGVLLQPAAGRWPAHEPQDRLALGVGGAALAAGKIDDERFAPYRAALAELSQRIVAAGAESLPDGIVALWPLGAQGELEVVPWEGVGRLTVTVEVTGTGAGPVPTLRDAPRSEGANAICALALLLALAAQAGAEDRLALALGLEGVACWYAASHRASPPRHALTYALAHARDRLRGAGRALPPALAIDEG